MSRKLFSSLQLSVLACVICSLLTFCACNSSQVASEKQSSPNSAPKIAISNVKVSAAANQVLIASPSAEFAILPDGSVRATLVKDGKRLSLDHLAATGGSAKETGGEAVVVAGRVVNDFHLDLANAHISDSSGRLGESGKRVEIKGDSASLPLEIMLQIEVYDAFPQMAISSMTYRNRSDSEIALQKVITQQHWLDASQADSTAKPFQMWSFQGASIDWGKDEMLSLPAKFTQANVLGAPLKDGHGGGIPVDAFWTRSVGEAIGHLETLPLVLSAPVAVRDGGRVNVGLQFDDVKVAPGASYATPRSFVSVFAGDYYDALRMYSLALQKEGWTLPKPNAQDFGVAWCGWGYLDNVTPKQMTDTIPKLKELGIRWATLDDRWFNNYGDWQPRKDTFPGNAIKEMVDTFHQNGMYAQVWWYPLVVEDGHGGYESHKYATADVVKQHPDWLILGKDGKPGRSFRGLATLCPAVPEVRAYTKQLTERFIRDWGFDGSKLDNIYSVPACYNPKHHHQSPQDSITAMGDVYREIFQTTRALKPESVTQICPCGTTPNLAWLADMDQAVTADPVGGVQVRRRIKMYKALLGPQAAVYGDHVELSEMTRVGKNGWSEHGSDFASTLGPGGVLGTKFTVGDNDPKYKNVALTTEKDAQWKKWIGLYNQKMLSQGEFRNLYVYGYDSPEAYAIEKDGKMYYAFFASDPKAEFSGTIELRGLQPGRYRITDYVERRDLGTIDAAKPTLEMRFVGHLLVEAEGSR